MKILENEIASIEPFGVLDGKPVNLLRTNGGLSLATTKDKNGEDTVLGAASHQAILCYTIEQRFPSFQPMIMKSEGGQKLTADKHSHFLSDDLRKSGHDIFSIQNGNNVQFYVTKQNIRVAGAGATCEVQGNTLFIGHLELSKREFDNAFCSAVSEKALSIGLKNVKWDD